MPIDHNNGMLQVLGHTVLRRGTASNWGGAPNYSNLGQNSVHMIPDSTGNGRIFP
jgi:hypothetical protein